MTLSVAIIGSGISGLGIAALLHPSHDITLYEKSSDIGGHARTRVVEYGDKKIAVDTGFIVFNFPNYPLLTALFKHLQVPFHESDMTFAVTAQSGGLEWGAKDLNAVFGQRSNLVRPHFWRLIYDVMKFNRHAPALAEKHPDITLKQLLEMLNMGPWFAPYYILPMGGAIWSCPLDRMLAFPALNFIRFFKAHGLLSITGQPQWQTVTGGSQEYVNRLIAPFKNRIRNACGVVSVRRHNGQVYVVDAQGETRIYDRVVFACHADQTLAMLDDATEEERRALSTVTYQKNIALLHRDSSVMPKRKRCWASWVYHPDGTAPTDPISVTYWMNLLQGIDEQYPLFVTLNPGAPIAPELVFDTHVFEHPVYSLEAVRAQEQIQQLQGKNHSWFCGAYLRNGFHEDGLYSAVEVAKHMGVSIPWR